MSQQVQTIKDRLSIVDVLSGYIQLEPSGLNYKARCPFHNEKTPSFYVSTERNSYYCFGCGAKGDIFSFVQNFEGVDFIGALKFLANKAGVVLENNFTNEKKDDNTVLYVIMEQATLFFENKFSENKEAQKYLSDRGVHNKTIESFRIGFAPDSWRSVSDHLIAKGYNIKDIEKVGLIKINGDKSYDRFRSRIMFPIFDSSGRVIAFSGRIFTEEGKVQNTPTEEVAKYLNSPETSLFSKSNVFFGIDRAKLSIRSRGYCIIVEGQMDLIMSHQAGFTNTIASSGTAFTSSTQVDSQTVNNLGLVRRLSPNIIFAFDGDKAGIRACNRAALIAFSLEMQVKVAVLKNEKDPADIIKENPDEWKDIIRKSKNIISFNLDLICDMENEQRIRGKKIRENIFPLLIHVKSEIEKQAYFNEISSKTSIPVTAIISDFETYQKTYKTKTEDSDASLNSNQISRKDNIQRKLFGLIFLAENNKQDLSSSLDRYKEIVGEDQFKKFYETFLLQKDELSFEAQIWYSNEHINLVKEYDLLLDNLEEEYLNEKVSVLLQEISNKERIKDNDGLQKLLLIYQQTTSRIESIKNKRLNI